MKFRRTTATLVDAEQELHDLAARRFALTERRQGIQNALTEAEAVRTGCVSPALAGKYSTTRWRQPGTGHALTPPIAGVALPPHRPLSTLQSEIKTGTEELQDIDRALLAIDAEIETVRERVRQQAAPTVAALYEMDVPRLLTAVEAVLEIAEALSSADATVRAQFDRYPLASYLSAPVPMAGSASLPGDIVEGLKFWVRRAKGAPA